MTKPWVKPRVIVPTFNPTAITPLSRMFEEAGEPVKAYGYVALYPPTLFLDYDKVEARTIINVPSDEFRSLSGLYMQQYGRSMRPRPRHKSKSRGWRKYVRSMKARK